MQPIYLVCNVNFHFISIGPSTHRMAQTLPNSVAAIQGAPSIARRTSYIYDF